MTSTGTGQARNEAGAPPDGELTIAIDPRTAAAGPVAKDAWQLVPSSRYRHPGDVIRLVASGLVLIMILAAVAVAPGQLVRSRAPAVTWLGSGSAGRVLIGLVQVAFVIAAAAVAAAVLRHRRFRLLGQLVAGALIAGAALSAILHLAADKHPPTMASITGHGSWLAGAWFPSPALFATAAAIAVAVAPWLSRPWRRTTWLMLSTMVWARLITGTVLPVELLLALAVGVTVGASVLVAFGVPDNRMGPDGVAEALQSAGLPTTVVEPAGVRTKGSRPFVAVGNDGRRLFIKALGSDQRDADLLYRVYRFARLRNVGDTWPAASAIRAVERQALVGMSAERAGVQVPSVVRVVRAGRGTALLAMERVNGTSLIDLPPQAISDQLLLRLWAEVGRLHRAGIAHRCLRAANVMVEGDAEPWLTDFSFSELSASQRQKDLDIAELLASLATMVGAARAVSSAAAVIGHEALAAAVPLLQPLALSAATRHAIGRMDGLLSETRTAASAASGLSEQPLARLQRVRLKNLLAIAAAAGAFYFILPQLAHVGSSWRALQSAHWAWLPVVLAASGLTYLASAAALISAIPGPIPFWPTTLTQAASSFVNRVSPANLGGMALNTRFLQKRGVPPGAGIAAVGVNALMGAVAHLVLMVIFFSLAGHELAHTFKLPPASKMLLILAGVAALVGIVLATSRGRRFAATRILPGLRSAAASLRTVAASPFKLALLVGASAMVTLAYIAGLVASVQAFGGGVGIAEIGAVYLGAAVIAAVSPTPGGLGAIEAALVAGLTGVGMHAGPAVSAVLTYRLATYWLPIVPGWLSLRFLQRRDYV
ncbi:MAG TPA: lysylphosphatidylglycerol synthase transmembrane domain-containing protein [Acidimicrobiales bacterium]|nr:lysylphosphatidylglycerol synthase transmembrane domain-containing protein [Acidimicrobiales bacterium]